MLPTPNAEKQRVAEVLRREWLRGETPQYDVVRTFLQVRELEEEHPERETTLPEARRSQTS